MAIEAPNATDAPRVNGHAKGRPGVAPLDPSKLKITVTPSPKPTPPPETLKFGQTMTDHMLIASYDPEHGWSDPEIKPYGPICLDPASSCFQYSTNVFEGMKAYVGPDGEIALPSLYVTLSAVAVNTPPMPHLQPFDTDALLVLIQRLVALESHWIPNLTGYSLYLRPTMIGTRPNLGVTASDHAMLYVICSPAGPYFGAGAARQISLLANGDVVRSWPGGTGGYKLALNYAPTLKPQQFAELQGYNQVLWLLDGKITEAGAMNFFVVVKQDEHNWDVVTPPLDGTILPGVTRDSCLALAAAHPARTLLPHLPEDVHLHVQERTLTMDDLRKWHEAGRLLEAFTVGTAVVVTGVGRIGYEARDILLPEHASGRGPVARALYERIVAIQEGKFEWEGWSVVCKTQ